jgi:hypothetical protein
MFSSAEPPSLLHHACMCRMGKPSRPYPPQKTTPRAQQKREQGTRLEDKSRTLRLLVTTELEVLASLESELCLGLWLLDAFCTFAWEQAVPCRKCTLDGERPSWWSSPSTRLLVQVLYIIKSTVPYGRRAWSDHHNHSACDHNDAFPGRTAKLCRPCTG